MIVKTAIGFLRTNPDGQLIIDVQAIISGLTNNPDFPSPTPTIAAVSSALDAFTVAKAEAVKGGKEATALKRAARAELVALLRQLANYITDTSDGDLTKLLSTKFPIQKPTRSPVGQLPPPDAPTLKFGMISGELDAATSPVNGASTYNWRVALASAPDVYVQTAQTTGGRMVFEALTPGQVYSVQVCAVGAAGPSNWSDNSKLMVV